MPRRRKLPQLGGPFIGGHMGLNPFGTLWHPETLIKVGKLAKNLYGGENPISMENYELAKDIYYQTSAGRREKFHNKHGNSPTNAPTTRAPTITQKKNISSNYRMAGYKAPMPRKYVSKKTGKTTYRRPPTSKKGATNRKNKSNQPKPKAKNTLVKQVKDLQKKVNISLSKHTHRYAEGFLISAFDGECDHYEVSPLTTARFEAYTNNLRYYNPATPGTLTTADPTTATYSQDIKVKNVYTKLTFKNNNFIPVNVKVYLCKLKHDTASGVLSEYTNAIADQVITAGADTESLMIYLTDIERLRENWNIDCVLDKRLTAGQVATCGHGTGEYDYDPSEQDADDEYKVRNKYFAFVVRVQGDLAHDSTNTSTEHGIMNVNLDCMEETKAEFIYDAGGVSLNDISFNDQRSSFTNGSITCLPSIPDNLGSTLS